MRAAGRAGRTVTLRLRFDDFTRVTRSRTLTQATTNSQILLHVARTLRIAAQPMISRRGVTLIGIAIGNLHDGLHHGMVQLELPLQAHSDGRLDAAVDAVRDRFGSAALTRGALLGTTPGLTVPLLPD
jgi:DNA polymerase-4